MVPSMFLWRSCYLRPILWLSLAHWHQKREIFSMQKRSDWWRGPRSSSTPAEEVRFDQYWTWSKKRNGLDQGSQTQILPRTKLAIKMFRRPHNEGKMALRAAVLWRRLSRATYVVKYDYISSFFWLYLLTTFLPKQHKNSNISINILILLTYIFCEECGLHGHTWWATCHPRALFLRRLA